MWGLTAPKDPLAKSWCPEVVREEPSSSFRRLEPSRELRQGRDGAFLPYKTKANLQLLSSSFP